MSTQTPLDLKQTVNLSGKALPMKADLIQSEPVRRQHWKETNLYEQILKSRERRPRFILHDGPPYANGRIHTGHALNKIFKDFLVKSPTMMGYHCPYIPGWDCHGLPIEIQVDEKLNKKKPRKSVGEIRRQARKHAEHFIKAHVAGFLDQLHTVFIVSQVVPEQTTNETLVVTVVRADGEKCERRWNDSTTVGQSDRSPTVCGRCRATLLELEAGRM